MADRCRQCGSTHVIEKDHMIICDDCLSTIVLKEDGSVLSEYLTNEMFRMSYSELKGSLQLYDDNFRTACKTLLTRQGDIPPLLNLAGMYYIQNERYGDAIKVLKQAVDLNPLYITACYNLAVAYHYMGYNELSIKYFEEARKHIEPGDKRYVDIMSGCALALSEAGRLVKAEDYLEKAEAQGFTHGDEIRLVIGTKEIEAEEIPGTNRFRGDNTNSQSNTGQHNNQNNGNTKPLWPYIVGIVILVMILISNEVGYGGGFVIGVIIYFLGSKAVKIMKNNADNSNNTNSQ